MHTVDVVGFGASSFDFVYLLPALPAAGGGGSKIRIQSHFVGCGGQVTTALAACASLGHSTRYLGPLGTDTNAERIRDELRWRQIDLSHAIVRAGASQFAAILIDERTGDRIVLWDRDPALAVDPDEIDPQAVAAARVLHVDDVDEAGSIRAASLARERGVTVTSDLDRVTGRTRELIDAVTIPIFAEHVPEALTGEADPGRALRALRKPHHRLLVVTLGERGATALDGDREVHVPAFGVRAADTTAAGDVFRAGVIHALLAGRTAGEMLAWGNAAAAVSCTRRGAMSSVPTREEVETLLRG